jgi:phage gp16-like protein
MDAQFITTSTAIHAEADRLVAEARQEGRKVIYNAAVLTDECSAGVLACAAMDVLVRQGRAVSLDEWKYNEANAQCFGRAILLP